MKYTALIITALFAVFSITAALAENADGTDDIRIELIEVLKRSKGGDKPAAADAGVNAPVEVEAARPDGSADEARKTELDPAQRHAWEVGQAIVRLLGTGPGPEEIDRRLQRLIAEAGRLSLVAEEAPTKYQALRVQMGAIYMRIINDPAGPQVDRMLGRLRAAARRAKALPDAMGEAEGDFWLMTAELFGINRSDLPQLAKQEQVAQLLQAFIEDHRDASMTPAVRQRYVDLQKARGLKMVLVPADEVKDDQPTAGADE